MRAASHRDKRIHMGISVYFGGQAGNSARRVAFGVHAWVALLRS
jgi:hypothetical protein